MNSYSLRDVINATSKEKIAEDSFLGWCIYRPVSNFLAYLSIKAGISANAISVLSVLVTIIACVLFAIPSTVCNIWGFVFLNLFPIFDCVDGTIARTVRKASAYGEFFDALGGYTMLAFPLLFASYMDVNIHPLASQSYVAGYLCVCALGCTCSIYARLVYQRYRVSAFSDKSVKVDNPSKMKTRKKSLTSLIKYLVLRVNKLIGVGDGFALILCIGYIIDCLKYIVLLYSLYNIAIAMVTVIQYTKKANK